MQRDTQGFYDICKASRANLGEMFLNGRAKAPCLVLYTISSRNLPEATKKGG